MANSSLRRWSLLAIVLLACTPAAAQFPDKFTNLKVLPKDISKREPESTMRGLEKAPGERCDHCHAEKKAPEKGLDFPARRQGRQQNRSSHAADGCRRQPRLHQKSDQGAARHAGNSGAMCYMPSRPDAAPAAQRRSRREPGEGWRGENHRAVP